MTDKTISGYLVVDWKREKLKVRKTKPSTGELGTNELLSEVKVDVTVPEVDVPTLAVEIDVPEPQVYAATLEALDDEDLPDWSNVAVDKVDDYRVAFEQAGNAPEMKEAIDQATVDTLREAPGRPDVEHVREFIKRTAADMHSDGVAPVGGDE